MSSVQPHVSSGSEGDPQYVMVDERKKRRMLSNRESARRSRMRKQQHLDDLLNQVSQLQKENGEMSQKIKDTMELYRKAELDNNILRVQIAELTGALQSLKSVLQIVQEVRRIPMDIPKIPDPLMNPWQLPCPSQPTMSSGFAMDIPEIPDPLMQQWQLPCPPQPIMSSGFAMDIPEIPDPLMKPLQVTCQSQPIMASPSMFQY